MTAAYRLNHRYVSGTMGPFEAGSVIDLDDATVEWLERDSPGCLSRVDEEIGDDQADAVEDQPVDEPTPPRKAAKKAAPKGA